LHGDGKGLSYSDNKGYLYFYKFSDLRCFLFIIWDKRS